MNRKTISEVIAIFVVFAVLYIFFSSGEDVVIGPNITESDARNIIGGKYPNITGDMVHEDDCEICNDTNCTNLGEPCWKTNVSVNGSKASVTIGSGDGEFLGISETCLWWECTPISCIAMFYDGNVTYYNNDCDNPVPKCDEEQEICRPCGTKRDCLRIRTYQGIQENNLVGSSRYGYYEEFSGKCLIMELYINITTLEECEEDMLELIDCVDGFCVEV